LVSVGVERGGTWLRIEAFHTDGKPFRSTRLPSTDLPELPALLRRAFRRWRMTPDLLAVASRGVWSMRERRRLKRALEPLAPRVLVFSDVEAAWLAALAGDGHGILLISGTGSIAMSKDLRQKIRRAGGLGPQRGDEGSAYWIGRQWLKQPYKPQEVRKIAGQAAHAWSASRRGDKRAREIISQAVDHLVKLVIALAAQGRWPMRIPLAFRGGVIENRLFQRQFLRRLRRERRYRFRIRKPTKTPAAAIAQTIMQTYG
jgi:N-acetylglucosamine kinase-like BadF-type ATPase